MEGSIGLMLLLQIVLIMLNAFFACAEIALISVNENKIARKAEEGDKRATLLIKMNKEPAGFLATIQIAITLSGFLASAFAADNFAGPLVSLFVQWGVPIPENILHSVMVVVITLILSYFTLVFGELVPKQIAIQKADVLALKIAGLIHGISIFFGPLVKILTFSTDLVLKAFGMEKREEDEEISEDEIRFMVDMGREKGTIGDEEGELIENVFEFNDITAEEIVTHRTEIVMLNMDDPVETWENIIFETRHTLYPVWKENQDHIIGILNIKDYFRIREKTKENIMNAAVTNAYFVPDTVKADVLFRDMKKKQQMMALVMDEYGGVTGLVTMNDMVEELVGELVNDTVNENEMQISQISDSNWRVQGSVSLEEISEITGVNLENDDYDTLNGMVFHELGNIPENAEDICLTIQNLKIQVEKIENHKIISAVINLSE